MPSLILHPTDWQKLKDLADKYGLPLETRDDCWRVLIRATEEESNGSQ